jgi:glycosyltransferase involved in cell wall biosynthesis
MRILYHHRIRSKDGQFVHIEEMISALRAQGHEVVLCGPHAVASDALGSDGGVVNVLKKCIPSPVYELMESAYAIVDYLRLRRAVRRYQPDAIYERYNLFSPAGVLVKRRYRLPLLLEINAPVFDERAKYGGLTLRRLARCSEQYVWKRADALLPVTKVLARRIEQEGIPPSRIRVIPNGVDLRRFEGCPSREEAKQKLGLAGQLVLGFVGFVREWHGLDRVLDILAARQKKGQFCHLMIVGEGPAKPSIEKQAQALGINSSITFTGVVPRDELPLYLSAFDIALQPAVVDYASPLKVFEYMAASCAIVAPATPNILEILTHGEDAYLFPPGRPESLGHALDVVCSDSLLCERLGRCARRTLSRKGLLWENNARTVIALFEKLLQGESLASVEPASAAATITECKSACISPASSQKT